MSIQLATFLSLDGKANQALTFYQEIFQAKVLFKITNQQFKECLNPQLEIPNGQEEYISHSILQIGTTQLQIADTSITSDFLTSGTNFSLSFTINNLATIESIYQKIIQYDETQIIAAPCENEFADFYAIVRDPFGVLLQLTKEKQPDPEQKGKKRNPHT